MFFFVYFILNSICRATKYTENSMKNHIVVFISQQYDWWKLVVDVTTLKMARKLVQDTLGKVNRIKKIRRREKDGIKITYNTIM